MGMNSAPKPRPTIATLTFSDIYTSASRQLPTSNSQLPREACRTTHAFHPDASNGSPRELEVGRWKLTLGDLPCPPSAPLRCLHVQHAVHDSPVAGKRADVGILAGLGRRLELHRHRLAGFDQLGREDHLLDLRHVLLCRTIGRTGEVVGRRPDRLERALLPEHEVV